MKPLEPPDTFHLDAARGWLGLGDHRSAFDELELITPSLRAHPDVLTVRCDIYSKAGKWDMVLAITSGMVELAPNNSHGWIQRSFALHELKRTQEAFDLLLPALRRFPKIAVISYNLACYCAQLRRLKESKRWLSQAFKIGDAKELKLIALDDTDLEPLWKGLAKI
jgi:tetratricopeptide (TPR) repeat protein